MSFFGFFGASSEFVLPDISNGVLCPEALLTIFTGTLKVIDENLRIERAIRRGCIHIGRELNLFF